MSTFTEINNVKTTPLDGPNDLVDVKTSFILSQEAAAKAAEEEKSSEE